MKKERGITLIALIVTIIILLILAGVTVVMLTGENGLLNRASTAAEKTKIANAKDRLNLELMNIQTEKIWNGESATIESLDEYKESLATKSIEITGTGETREATLDGYTFTVLGDLTIKEDVKTSTGSATGGQNGGTEDKKSDAVTLQKIDFFGEKVASPFDGGDGSESNPFLISTEGQLRMLSAMIDYGENTYEGVHFKLTKDITLNSTKQWRPIGNDTIRFQGTFDGNGKTISGIYIENEMERQGLFGVIGQNGVINNLSVSGNITAGKISAGLSGVNMGRITGCKNEVTVTKSGNITTVGGIAGLNYGTIEESCNTGSVTGHVECVAVMQLKEEM